MTRTKTIKDLCNLPYSDEEIERENESDVEIVESNETSNSPVSKRNRFTKVVEPKSKDEQETPQSGVLIGSSEDRHELAAEIDRAYESLFKDEPKEMERQHETSVLIGSSEERHELAAEIDRAYNESLLKDQQKEIERQRQESEEEEILRRQQQLQDCRKDRVLPEASLSGPHVTITVRHTIMGNKTRIFQDNLTMTQVYDWVGSLNLVPEHFHLLNYNGEVILPESAICSGVYNMQKSDNPVLLTPSGTVSFSGYGCDDNLNTSDSTNDFTELQNVRNAEFEKLSTEELITVNRENIYQDFIKIFSRRGAVKKYTISFEGETAIGDGVTRDAYSSFFQKMRFIFHGDFEWIPLPTAESEELNIIGKVITTAFLTQNIFPVELCQSSFQHVMYDVVSDNELFESFLKYLCSQESSMILGFMEGKNSDKQAILDILSEAQIYAQPTKENIVELCIKAAKIILVRLPLFSLKAIVNGMGEFWKKTTVNMFRSIYECSVPTDRKCDFLSRS